MKCQNFQWYLQHVYPEKFILDENVIAYGDIRVVNADKCLDTMGVPEGYNKEIGLYNCQAGESILQVTLLFVLPYVLPFDISELI